MTPSRRRFLRLAGAATTLPALSRFACGAILSGAAGTSDRHLPRQAARPTSSRDLPGNICRSGSLSNSWSRTSRAPPAISPPNTSPSAEPDGYTILMPVSTNAVNVALYRELNSTHPRHRASRGHRHNSFRHQSCRHRSRPGRCPRSPIISKPIPARSTWARPASGD